MFAIPALSPGFDPDWESAGHIESAVRQVSTWMKSRPVSGHDSGGPEAAGADSLDCCGGGALGRRFGRP